MSIVKKLLALMACAALVSCGGGGGDAGTPPFGGGGTPTTKAARLALALASNSVSNGGTGTVEATATATDANGQTLPGVVVTFQVDGGANFTQTESTTNDQGQVKALVSIGTDRSNRIITIKAKAAELNAEASFAVTGARLSGTPLPAVVQPGSTGNRVEFRLVDANGNPMVGQKITVSGPGVSGGEGVTGANGDFNFVYTAPSQLGNLDLTAVSGGVSLVQTVLVQSSESNIPVVTQPIRSASVAATPSVVAVNSASTNNRSEIRVLFLGDSNAPIRNVRVRFDLNGDANSIGGTFSAQNNLVYSDANGVATTAYIPAGRSSPTDGLTVRACYSGSDFPAGTCPNQTLATLTVTNEPLGVTIGTNELIEEGEARLTYIKRFVVLVVDSSGKAMANVEITPSIDLTRFGKGAYEINRGVLPVQWQKVRGYAEVDHDGDPTTPPQLQPLWGGNVATCANEDKNRNGVLEAGEDLDGDGALEPRRSDVAISMTGSNKTDAGGRAFLAIEYPKNEASWVEYNILVAGSVSGTEGRANFAGTLPVPASAVLTVDSSPAFQVSPYGSEPGCDNPN